MYKEIPLMNDQSIKQGYAQQLQNGLGEGTNWTVTTAAFTPGVIVSPLDGAKFQDNGCGKIGRMYVLGVPPREDLQGIKGVCLVTTADISRTSFYETLTEKMGFKGIVTYKNSRIEKHLDTTDDVISTLKDLEKIVFAQ